MTYCANAINTLPEEEGRMVQYAVKVWKVSDLSSASDAAALQNKLMSGAANSVALYR